MPRRSAKPPYEIMNVSSRPSAGGVSPRSVSRRRGQRSWSLPDVSAARDAVGGWVPAVGEAIKRGVAALAGVLKPEGQAGPWWIGSTTPVVLKLARGTVVAGVAGVVGLVLLAYWIGLGQGQDAAGKGDPTLAGAEAVGTGPDLDAQPWRVNDDTGLDIPGGAEGTVLPLGRRDDAGDPRKPGLNYLVYAMADLEESRRLQAFLKEHGVRTLIVPTSHRVSGLPNVSSGAGESGVAGGAESGDNAVLHLVVDVTEGFTREAYLSGDHRAFLGYRLKLGRAWQRHNGGHGSALESMMFYKYDPPVGTDSPGD